MSDTSSNNDQENNTFCYVYLRMPDSSSEQENNAGLWKKVSGRIIFFSWEKITEKISGRIIFSFRK